MGGRREWEGEKRKKEDDGRKMKGRKWRRRRKKSIGGGLGPRVFRAMGNETWSLVLCLWNVRIKRKRNILVAWKVKELRDWKETPDDTCIYIYIYTRPRMVRGADVPGDRGMDRKWMDFLQQFVRWMTVWVVKWDFVTVEFEEIGEGLDGFKFGKFGKSVVGWRISRWVSDLEFGWIVISVFLKIDDFNCF